MKKSNAELLAKRKPFKKNGEPAKWVVNGFREIMAMAMSKPFLPNGVVVIEINRRELEVINFLAAWWLDNQKRRTAWIPAGHKKFKMEVRELKRRVKFFLNSSLAKAPNIDNRKIGNLLLPPSDDD